MVRTMNVIMEKGGDGNYSCFLEDDTLDWGVVGSGRSVYEAMKDFYSGVDEMKKELATEGRQMPAIRFNFLMDVGSLFDYYPINVTAFAKYIGINASLLRQYASGKRVAKAKSLEKIRNGLEKLKNDLNAGSLIEKPVLQYVK